MADGWCYSDLIASIVRIRPTLASIPTAESKNPKETQKRRKWNFSERRAGFQHQRWIIEWSSCNLEQDVNKFTVTGSTELNFTDSVQIQMIATFSLSPRWLITKKGRGIVNMWPSIFISGEEYPWGSQIVGKFPSSIHFLSPWPVEKGQNPTL